MNYEERVDKKIQVRDTPTMYEAKVVVTTLRKHLHHFNSQTQN